MGRRNRKKDFDCVELKHDVQSKMAEEFAGLSDQERNNEAMLSDLKSHLLFQDLLGRSKSLVADKEKKEAA